MIKGFEGEKNVLKAKIEALESLTKDQGKQIEKLNNQQEKAGLVIRSAILHQAAFAKRFRGLT